VCIGVQGLLADCREAAATAPSAGLSMSECIALCGKVAFERRGAVCSAGTVQKL
jgi:hypothetical protein